MVKKVFVSGCYDMLHSGHMAFFEEAATHGDLYVGLGLDNPDEAICSHILCINLQKCKAL